MIRHALKKDCEKILLLNQKDVEMLSPLDTDLLTKMDGLCELFDVIEIDGEVAAFILAFRDRCEYWSDNYKWFQDNCSNFIYIDRIVIDESFRRQGLAQKLYEHVFEHAKSEGCDLVCAEIDIEPEYNHSSMNFHKKMGFKEIGKRLSKKTITVSLQIRELD